MKLSNRVSQATLLLAVLTLALSAPAPAQDAPPADAPPLVEDAKPTAEEESAQAWDALGALTTQLEGLDDGTENSIEEVHAAAAACRDYMLAFPNHELAFNILSAHNRILRAANCSEEEIRSFAETLGEQGAGTDLVVAIELEATYRSVPDETDFGALYAAIEKLGEKRPDSPLATNYAADYIILAPMDAAVKRAKVEALLANPALGEMRRTQLEGWRHMTEGIGSPVSFQFADLNGAEVDTADWKGKVVLVDFWATWCVPCVEELPRLMALYETHHAAGLEVVGISCDYSTEALAEFIAARQIPWTQCPPAEGESFHPFAAKWGVRKIPTMFLIDKKGVLRSVEARSELETLIPALLAEEM
jgi:thiol-disulfide isomerase/thioredoxin